MMHYLTQGCCVVLSSWFTIIVFRVQNIPKKVNIDQLRQAGFGENGKIKQGSISVCGFQNGESFATNLDLIFPQKLTLFVLWLGFLLSLVTKSMAVKLSRGCTKMSL